MNGPDRALQSLKEENQDTYRILSYDKQMNNDLNKISSKEIQRICLSFSNGNNFESSALVAEKESLSEQGKQFYEKIRTNILGESLVDKLNDRALYHLVLSYLVKLPVKQLSTFLGTLPVQLENDIFLKKATEELLDNMKEIPEETLFNYLDSLKGDKEKFYAVLRGLPENEYERYLDQNDR